MDLGNASKDGNVRSFVMISLGVYGPRKSFGTGRSIQCQGREATVKSPLSGSTVLSVRSLQTSDSRPSTREQLVFRRSEL